MLNLKDLETAARQHTPITNIAYTDKVALCVNIQDIPTTPATYISVTFMKNREKTFKAIPPDAFKKIMRWVETWIVSLKSTNLVVAENGDDRLYYTSLARMYTDKDFLRWNCHRLFFMPQGNGKSVIQRFSISDASALLQFPEISQVILVSDVAGVAKITRIFEPSVLK